VELADSKRFMLETLVTHGYSTAADIPETIWGGATKAQVEKWVTKFYKNHSVEKLPISNRLVNRFMVGADPEFTFMRDGEFSHATNYNLHVGLAFGADLAGRPVELRPAPSRFVLDVLASILAELRWMAITAPATLSADWVSRPYVNWDGHHDGIGGHVHFGRKRLNVREDEIKGMDRLFDILTSAEVFLRDDVKARRAKTNYGRYGDFRPQHHGYEYRSMPTWLENPWLAYLTMVLSKLTVYNPGLVKQVRAEVSGRKFIRNILAFYKGMDDDALIAYNTLSVLGYPTQAGKDFKQAWGINYTKLDVPKIQVDYIPEIIDGSEEDRIALFEHFRTGRPMPQITPKPNWAHQLPKGYKQTNHYIPSVQRKGIGELIAGTVIHTDQPLQIDMANGGLQVYGPPEFLATLPSMKEFGGVQKLNDERILIYLPKGLRESNEQVKEFRKVLLQYFPIWKASEVTEDSYKKFMERFKNAPKQAPVNLRGRELEV